jgi:quinol monooxygenase YgiN
MLVQTYEYPGVTQAQYEGAFAQLELNGSMPEGCLAHVAGEMPGGWRIVEVWESQEDFDRFHQEQLQHAHAANDMSLVEPVSEWEAHTVVTHGRWHHSAAG